MRSGGLRAPLRPMPRPETRGFLERRRARRASVAVAAGPERGDAPREGSRGALCSRYASTISRRQQLSAATDRRRSTFIYFEAYANGNRVYKIRKSTETRSHKKIPRFFFFFVSDSSPKSAFWRKNFPETTNRRVTFRALSTTPTSSHHADFRQDSCVHPPSFHRELRVTSASPPPRRGRRPRLGRPFRDGS